MPSIALPVSLRGQLLNTTFDPSRLSAGSTTFAWFDPSDVANTNWRRNLLTWTEQFDNAAWTKTAATVTPNAAVAPDGTTTADKIVEDTANSAHDISSASIAFVTETTYTITVFARTTENRGLRISGSSAAFPASSRRGLFNLTNGTVVSNDTGTTASITSVGGGWWRCSLTLTANVTASASVFFSLLDASNATPYTGDGTSGILIWGAQLELGTTATEYQRITDVNTEVIQRFPTATLYQDAAGTTPVTAPAQPVGLVLDKSQGLVLGPELVTNGDFSGGSTGWTAGPGWSVTGGAAVCNNTSGVAQNIDQSVSFTAARSYRVSFTISSYVSGNFYVRLSGGTNVDSQTFSANGSYSILVTAVTGNNLLVFRAANNTSLSIDNISVRELPGFHATQSTAANRPTYGVVPSRGRVNLLTRTEEFDNAAWVKTNSTVTANAAVAPDGTTTADTLVSSTINAAKFLSQSGLSSTVGTFTVYAKAAGETVISLWLVGASVGASFTLTGAGSTTLLGATSSSITSVGDGWYRCQVYHSSATTTAHIYLRTGTGYIGDGTSGILIWGAQLELGSTASPYQRVVSQFEVTDPVGFPSYPLHYLFFGGDLDPRWLQTSTITPSADKVQVFAGVRKLSDAAFVVIVESSSNYNNVAGSFLVSSATSGRYNLLSHNQSITSGYAGGDTSVYAAPHTAVLSAGFDLSGNTLGTENLFLRVNGANDRAVPTGLYSDANVNFAAQPLFIGRRGGTSLAFNGQLYGLIVRFSTANLDASLINQTERWMAYKTGVTI